MLCLILAKAFKEGKIPSNPLAGVMRPPGGAMIPPPAGLRGGPPMPGVSKEKLT